MASTERLDIHQYLILGNCVCMYVEGGGGGEVKQWWINNVQCAVNLETLSNCDILRAKM